MLRSPSSFLPHHQAQDTIRKWEKESVWQNRDILANKPITGLNRTKITRLSVAEGSVPLHPGQKQEETIPGSNSRGKTETKGTWNTEQVGLEMLPWNVGPHSITVRSSPLGTQNHGEQEEVKQTAVGWDLCVCVCACVCAHVCCWSGAGGIRSVKINMHTKIP